jgi:hypothetical protein
MSSSKINPSPLILTLWKALKKSPGWGVVAQEAKTGDL